MQTMFLLQNSLYSSDNAVHIIFFSYILIILQGCSLSHASNKRLPAEQSTILIRPGNIAAIKAFQFCYEDILSLPHNYPEDYFPHNRVFTDEIYVKTPDTTLPPSDALFIPKDYKSILGSSIYHTFSFYKIPLAKSIYPNYKGINCDFLIQVSPIKFHVENDSLAQIEISYAFYDVQDNSFFEEIMTTNVISENMPHTLSGDSLVFMLGNHNINFHPQRYLLAVAVHNNAVKLIERISNVLSKKYAKQ